MEVMTEFLHEVASEFTSTDFIVEFVQGLVLIAILVFALPRLVRPRLAARRARIVSDLGAARTAGAERTRCQREAKLIVSRAHKDAKASMKGVRAEAEAERADAMTAADEEAAEIVARARDSLEAEKHTVVAQSCDEMVGLVTIVARRYIDETLSESERGALTEKLVLTSLESIDRLAVE